MPNQDFAFFYSHKRDKGIVNSVFQDSLNKDFFNYFEAKQEWWDKPSSSFTAGWTNPYFDFGAGNTDMITYYHPFFIKGKYSGVITIDIALDKLFELLLVNEEAFEHGFSSQLSILSQDSIVIYSDKEEYIGDNLFKVVGIKKIQYNKQEVANVFRDVFEKKTGHKILHDSENTTKYLAIYAPIFSTNWVSVSVIPYERITKAVYAELSKTILIIVIFLVFLIVFISLTSRFISVPIIKLSQQSLKIAEGDYHIDVGIKTKSEIGILANNFSQMKDKLIAREADLKKANKQLTELDEAKNKFLLLISHEIRTPLNGIIGFTTILNESIDDPELKELFEMLEESVDRLDRFSRKALEITRMQTVGRQMEKFEINANTIIEHVLDAHIGEADKKQLIISTDFSATDTIFVLEEYFTSSVDEILNNAIKYSNTGNTIEVKTFIEEDRFIVSIANTGDVIQQDRIEEITKSFALGEAHDNKNIGLGLSYVKTFLDIHDASLGIESDEKQTVFIMSFPLNKV
jgi:signal transduction histidine kinase